MALQLSQKAWIELADFKQEAGKYILKKITELGYEPKEITAQPGDEDGLVIGFFDEHDLILTSRIEIDLGTQQFKLKISDAKQKQLIN